MYSWNGYKASPDIIHRLQASLLSYQKEHGRGTVPPMDKDLYVPAGVALSTYWESIKNYNGLLAMSRIIFIDRLKCYLKNKPAKDLDTGLYLIMHFFSENSEDYVASKPECQFITWVVEEEFWYDHILNRLKRFLIKPIDNGRPEIEWLFSRWMRECRAVFKQWAEYDFDESLLNAYEDYLLYYFETLHGGRNKYLADTRHKNKPFLDNIEHQKQLIAKGEKTENSVPDWT